MFARYPWLPGIPLSKLPADVLSAERDVRSLAIQLGTFLRTLHLVPLGAAGFRGLREGATARRWDDLYRRIVELLFPLMPPDTHQQVRDHFERFLNDLRTRSLTSALVHGDFGAGNILYDPLARRVTGTIDFGAVSADDPGVDLTAASTIPPQLFDFLPEAYPEAVNMLDRVTFYRDTFALQEALFGVESGDQDALRPGLASYDPTPQRPALGCIATVVDIDLRCYTECGHQCSSIANCVKYTRST